MLSPPGFSDGKLYNSSVFKTVFFLGCPPSRGLASQGSSLFVLCKGKTADILGCVVYGH